MLKLEDLERRYSNITLPSDGVFYENKCKKVKLYHLEGNDITLLTDANLIASGDLIDTLLYNKVTKADGYDVFIPPQKMTVGDRNALIIMLRIHLEKIYKIPLTDPATGKRFIHDFDLTSLKTKDIKIIPNDDNTFDFVFEKSFQKDGEFIPTTAKFRLMTGEDEKRLRDFQKNQPMNENQYTILKLKELITEIGENKDKTFIEKFLRQCDMGELMKLNRHMNDVTPGLDMNINVVSPGGETINTFLRFSIEFLMPGILGTQ